MKVYMSFFTLNHLCLNMVLSNSVKTKSKRIINPDGKIKRNLKICAFNIQIFGDAKMADDFVRTNLIKIFKNFDLVAVQGKRLSSLK